ncbi:IS5/IS1182 family transposase, partial [Acinetobacter baumannii]
KDTKSSSLERNELLRAIKRLGRILWKKWSGYHRRSLVETKMHCIKLLGDKLSARSFDSQVNEIHARVAVLNRFTELGRPLTQVTP